LKYFIGITILLLVLSDSALAYCGFQVNPEAACKERLAELGLKPFGAG